MNVLTWAVVELVVGEGQLRGCGTVCELKYFHEQAVSVARRNMNTMSCSSFSSWAQ